MAWSCCEYLLSLKAYTVFATHMDSLAELATIYPNVKVLHFYVDIRDNRLDFKFQLRDGTLHVPHYGLLLAEVAGLPNTVIETARTITLRITDEEEKRIERNCGKHHEMHRIYRVVQKLICLKYSRQAEDSFTEERLKRNHFNPFSSTRYKAYHTISFDIVHFLKEPRYLKSIHIQKYEQISTLFHVKTKPPSKLTKKLSLMVRFKVLRNKLSTVKVFHLKAILEFRNIDPHRRYTT